MKLHFCSISSASRCFRRIQKAPHKKTANLNKFLTINGSNHYDLDFDKKVLSYKRNKKSKFQKFTKFEDDFLINYNHYNNLWTQV